MRRLTRIMGISTTVVLLSGIATATYAGTGSPLLLGHKNKAPRTTLLISKHGPALSLKAPSGQPPFAVSSSKQVTHLNASLLDGKAATALETRARIYTLNALSGPISRFTADLTGLTHSAFYNVSYAVDLDASAPIICWIQQNSSGSQYSLLNYGVNISGISTSDATGVVRVPAGADLELACSANGGTMSIVDDPTDDRTVVTATPVDQAVVSQVTASTS